MTSGKIEKHHLDGMAALYVTQTQVLRKGKEERDTEFVKRIVCAYLNAHDSLASHVNGEISRPESPLSD